MSFFPRQALLVALGIGCLVCGCATTSTPSKDALPQKRPKLYRTQVGDQVTLQWESSLGTRYKVIYTGDISKPNAWRVLPGYEGIVGKGGIQVVTFTAPRPGKLYYRLSPVTTSPK